MNNDVKDWRGKVVGYRCFECNEVVPSMWGETCNACREKEERHLELLEAIKERSLEKKAVQVLTGN